MNPYILLLSAEVEVHNLMSESSCTVSKYLTMQGLCLSSKIFLASLSAGCFSYAPSINCMHHSLRHRYMGQISVCKSPFIPTLRFPKVSTGDYITCKLDI